MSSRKCYIKSRRENGMVVSEAYAFGNSWKDQADHGDARDHGSIYSIVNSPLLAWLSNRYHTCHAINGQFCSDGDGGIEMIEDCA